VIDFEGFMKALRQVNYKGVCSFEFEKDMQDPCLGLRSQWAFSRAQWL
jgi:sugar phosphate isomerase/epimerase